MSEEKQLNGESELNDYDSIQGGLDGSRESADEKHSEQSQADFRLEFEQMRAQMRATLETGVAIGALIEQRLAQERATSQIHADNMLAAERRLAQMRVEMRATLQPSIFEFLTLQALMPPGISMELSINLLGFEFKMAFEVPSALYNFCSNIIRPFTVFQANPHPQQLEDLSDSEESDDEYNEHRAAP